jgi:hypothetical protein
MTAQTRYHRYSSTEPALALGGMVEQPQAQADLFPGKQLWHPLYRRLGGTQRRSGRVWRKENLFSSAELKPRASIL